MKLLTKDNINVLTKYLQAFLAIYLLILVLNSIINSDLISNFYLLMSYVFLQFLLSLVNLRFINAILEFFLIFFLALSAIPYLGILFLIPFIAILFLDILIFLVPSRNFSVFRVSSFNYSGSKKRDFDDKKNRTKKSIKKPKLKFKDAEFKEK